MTKPARRAGSRIQQPRNGALCPGDNPCNYPRSSDRSSGDVLRPESSEAGRAMPLPILHQRDFRRDRRLPGDSRNTDATLAIMICSPNRGRMQCHRGQGLGTATRSDRSVKSKGAWSPARICSFSLFSPRWSRSTTQALKQPSIAIQWLPSRPATVRLEAHNFWLKTGTSATFPTKENPPG